MDVSSLTIGKLARAAGVGVETVRYYQQRELLAVPPTKGAFRYYPETAVARICFIKRAQELGFSLDEIAELLQLADGTDRIRIRQVTSEKIIQIESKLADLQRMHAVLNDRLDACEHADLNHPCPIIDSLMEDDGKRIVKQRALVTKTGR